MTLDDMVKEVSLGSFKVPKMAQFPTPATTFKGDLMVYVGGYPSAMKGWMLKHVSEGCGKNRKKKFYEC